jgi:hypothetical protein
MNPARISRLRELLVVRVRRRTGGDGYKNLVGFFRIPDFASNVLICSFHAVPFLNRQNTSPFMKITHLLLASVFALTIPASMQAADAAKKEAKKEGRKASKNLVALYDKNSDGKIDGEEAAALKKDFDADKAGPLKQFDTNADGKLDDSEIAAIKGGGKKKGEKKPQ